MHGERGAIHEHALVALHERQTVEPRLGRCRELRFERTGGLAWEGLHRASVGEGNPRVSHIGRVAAQLDGIDDGLAGKREDDAHFATPSERVAGRQRQRSAAVHHRHLAARLDELARRLVELDDA